MTKTAYLIVFLKSQASFSIIAENT